MRRLSANLSTLFPGVPLADRFGRARALGFDLVEIQYPYDWSGPGVGLGWAGLAQRLDLINARPGAGPERGLACLPGREADFRSGVTLALDYAARLDVPCVHVLSGIADASTSRSVSERLVRDNLTWACAQAAPLGISIVVEALNPIDVPGYFLRSLEDAEALIAEIEGLRLLFDVYHCRKAGGDPVAALHRCRSMIAHVQIADVPDRHEPGTGSVDWPAVFEALDAIGYDGPMGCEFTPRDAAGPDMAWTRSLSLAG